MTDMDLVTVLRSRLLTSAGLDSIPPLEPIIDGLLYLDSLAWVYGKPASGKSFLALDWAGHVASGLPWCGRKTAEGGVLYVAAEGTAGLQQRVRAWEDRAGHPMGVTFLPVAVPMMRIPERNALVELAAELRPLLVVIDTQARVTAGFDENSAKDMGAYVDAVDRVRSRSGACVLTVHHGGDRLRGSTVLEAAAESVMRVTKNGALIHLDPQKQKDLTDDCDGLRLMLRPHLESAVISPANGPISRSAGQPDSLQQVISCLSAAGVSRRGEIVAATGMPEATVKWALNRLVEQGIAYVTKQGRWPAYALIETPPANSG